MLFPSFFPSIQCCECEEFYLEFYRQQTLQMDSAKKEKRRRRRRRTNERSADVIESVSEIAHRFYFTFSNKEEKYAQRLRYVRCELSTLNVDRMIKANIHGATSYTRAHKEHSNAKRFLVYIYFFFCLPFFLCKLHSSSVLIYFPRQ